MKKRKKTLLIILITSLLSVNAGLFFSHQEVYADGEFVQVWFSSERNPGDEVWFHTELDATYKLSRQVDIPITLPDSSESTAIVIDPARRYQSIEGFGASLEGTSIYNLSNMSVLKKREALESLVSQSRGIGLNYIRATCGTSDYAAEYYTYDDMPYGTTDVNLENFSLQKDIDHFVISTLQQALSYNPEIKFIFSPWSPPAWMKDSQSLCAGSLQQQYINVAAKYYAKAIKEYRSNGLPISVFTLQNEPGSGPLDYPSCVYPWYMEKELAVALRHELDNNGLHDTSIAVLDHNFDMSLSFVKPFLDDMSGNASVDYVAFHDYGGNPEAATDIHNSFPEKKIILTERTLYGTSGSDRLIQYLRNWISGYCVWVPVMNSDQQPRLAPWNAESTLLVQDEYDSNIYWKTNNYYLLGQFSKFIKRNAVRIYSNYGSYDTITNVAFLNPDNSIVTVVVNQTNIPQSFKILCEGRQISATIPAKTTATYRWFSTGEESEYSIDAYDRITATDYTSAFGTVNEPCSEGGEYVGHISNGDYISFSDVEFGAGRPEKFYARVASIYSNAKVEIRLDSLDGSCVGVLNVPDTGGWDNWVDTFCDINQNINGKHRVYLKFINGGMNIRKFCFKKKMQFNHSVPVDAYTKTWADTFDPEQSSPGVEVNPAYVERTYVGNLSANDYLAYPQMDFGDYSPAMLHAQVGEAESGKTIEIRIDSVDGMRIGVLDVKNTGSWWVFDGCACAIKPGITGVHDVYLVFPQGGVNLDWFKFQTMLPNRGYAATRTFEKGDFSGWTEWHPDGEPTAYYVDTDDPHGGTYKCALWSESSYRQGVYTTFQNLQPGQYTVTAWVKQDVGIPNVCRMEISEYGGGSTLYTDIPHVNYYIQVQGTVVVSTTGTLTVGFYIDAPARTNLIIDDIYLCHKVDYNLGFEMGNYDGWTEWRPDGQERMFDTIEGDAFNGNHYCCISSESGFQQGVYYTYSNIANGTYTLSAWIKNPREATNICRMETTEYGGGVIYNDIAESGEYVLLTQQVHVTTGKLTVGFYVDSSNGATLQIDDVCLSRNILQLE